MTQSPARAPVPVATTRPATTRPATTRPATTRPATVAALAAALLAAATVPAGASDPIEARIDALLARMTLEEKIGQLTLKSDGHPNVREDVASGRAGAVINFTKAAATREITELWRKAPHGIPLLRGLDVLQGYRTIFPVPLAQAASFDAELNRRAAAAIARESAVQGINWTYAPMVDIGRDPRWGRVVEGAGEDPWLGALMARARVQGYRAGGLLVTPKHYVGYGAPRAGLDYAPADMSEETLRDVYLPPFRAAVEAGADAIMPALNALNGIPASVDGRLLKDVLRGEWGFDGFVVSDWGAIDQLGNHGIEPEIPAMAREAFRAGVDMDMASAAYQAWLPGEVAAGRIAMKDVDTAVRRVLRVKFRAGLDREAPILPPEQAEARMLAPETTALAVEVARRSIVLLKNERDLLPLDGVKRIALVGGIADSEGDHVGPHAAQWRPGEVTTIRQAMEARAARSGVAVEYRAGCTPDCVEGTGGFDAAVAAATAADVVVAVFGEPGEISGEAASRADLKLPGGQQALLERLHATGKPVILVIVAGRPLTLPWAFEKLPAVLTAWYPGGFGSVALAEILFGDVAPSGRLPMTWPRHMGQIPIAYDSLRSGRPASAAKFTSKYVDIPETPQFPFGFGLSTTRFAYRSPALDRDRVPVDGEVEVSVEVTNTGRREGREVVQLYVRDLQASRVRPERQLKGVALVDLKPGETRRVSIGLDVASLGFHRRDGRYVVEPGTFRLFVGGSSDADLSVDLIAEAK